MSVSANYYSINFNAFCCILNKQYFWSDGRRRFRPVEKSDTRCRTMLALATFCAFWQHFIDQDALNTSLMHRSASTGCVFKSESLSKLPSWLIELCTTQYRLIWRRSLPTSLIYRLDEDSDQLRLMISSLYRSSDCQRLDDGLCRALYPHWHHLCLVPGCFQICRSAWVMSGQTILFITATKQKCL